MDDSVEQAKASIERWVAAFNARDMDGMIADMHFPHRRLSGDNKFQVWETADDYRNDRGENTTKVDPLSLSEVVTIKFLGGSLPSNYFWTYGVPIADRRAS